jgi:general secretion pathway protein D
MSRQPVSAEEAITMLSAVLRVNGYSVTREGRLLHIGSRDKAKKENIPVHFGNDPAEVPQTEELITQVIPIENVSASKLRDDLKPLIGGDADVTSNEGSNSIIITDSSANIHRIVEIISQLDQHEATTAEVRIVQLKHADASTTAKLIEDLFKQSPEAPPQNPNMPMMGPQQQQQQNQGGNASQRHGQSVVAVADERTNTLLVMASSGSLHLIDDILQHLDADMASAAPSLQMQAFPLKFAVSDATAKLINNIFTPPKGPTLPILFLDFGDNPQQNKAAGVNAVSDDRTNTVVVTAPEAQMREVAELIHQLDNSPMASQELRVIHLKYADAVDVAKLIEDTFEPKSQESQPRLPFLFSLLSQPQQQPQSVHIVVTSDERTNTILVSAPTEMLEMIEGVVRQLDADPTTEDTLFIYHLRNSQSTHLEYTLNLLFGNITTGGQNGQNQRGLNQNQNQNPLLSSNTFGGQNAPPNPTSQNNATPATNGQTRQGSISPQIAAAISELTGKVMVVADPDSNSLIVTTASKYQRQVKELIAELDRPAAQVLIKVLIAEVTRDNNADFGTDFSVLNIRPSGNGQKLSSTLGAAAAAASTTTPGGMVVSILEDNVTATLQALAQENKLDILSRPYILTSDNQQADITVGSEVPFITDTNVDSTGGIHNSAQYRDIGIILTVTPHVNPEGLVTLEVSPQISSLTAQTVPIQTGVSLPVFDVRSADSYLTVRDGQTVVIGGMYQDQDTYATNKIPLLGDIPLLGKLLFSYTTDAKTKTELLIFLTPHVASEPDVLKPMTEDEERGLKLTPNAVGPGVFQDHMRGMQRGGPAQTQPSTPISPIKTIDLGNPPPGQQQ